MKQLLLLSALFLPLACSDPELDTQVDATSSAGDASTQAQDSEPTSGAKVVTPKKPGVVAGEPQDAMEIGGMPDGAWSDQAVAKVELERGLVVEYFTVGEGPLPKKHKQVMVHYQGWVKGSGQFFDSSFQAGAPLEFPLGIGRVIPGWDDGIMTMPAGSRARLHIPAAMAYGQGSRPGIPANSNLVFDVHLVAIIKRK